MRVTDALAAPQMFMHSPTSAAQLSCLSGSGTPWILGGASDENLALDTVVHGDMEAAPHAARVVAERLSAALGETLLPAGESDTTGRVVAIVGVGASGLPDKADLLTALGLKRRVDHVDLAEEASVTSKDYGRVSNGFCFTNEDLPSGDAHTPEHRRIRAATAVMAAELRDHFELNFSDEVVVAPVLYGGRAGDGSVVAVLSMRVWT